MTDIKKLFDIMCNKGAGLIILVKENTPGTILLFEFGK